MKKTFLFFTVLLIGGICSTLVACSEDNHSVPTVPEEKPEEITPGAIFDWEENRENVLESTDMVLLYAGGQQRQKWDKNQVEPYLKYVDREGEKHWLFDSFLFLEIVDTKDWKSGKAFTKGYDAAFESANKSDWEKLITNYFQTATGIGGLDMCLSNIMKDMGTPNYKHQVVIGIPEPMVNQFSANTSTPTKYWGKIENQELDFAKAADRVKACVWYVDQVRAQFNEKKYKNVELAGFYWIAEDATATRSILNSVANYLEDLKYSFNWIPFFNADGRSQWKDLGFTSAYYQPNYYFNDKTPKSRLEAACKEALNYSMNMEIEFEDNALKYAGDKGYRLRDYMEVFKQQGIWEKKRLAYYQSNTALVALKNSAESEDQSLYHDFCQFVVTRPMRDFY